MHIFMLSYHIIHLLVFVHCLKSKRFVFKILIPLQSDNADIGVQVARINFTIW